MQLDAVAAVGDLPDGANFMVKGLIARLGSRESFQIRCGIFLTHEYST